MPEHVRGEFAGIVINTCGGPAFCYYDGVVQAYDGITQTIATTPSAVYDVTFDLSGNCGNSTILELEHNWRC